MLDARSRARPPTASGSRAGEIELAGGEAERGAAAGCPRSRRPAAWTPHRAMVTITPGLDAAQEAVRGMPARRARRSASPSSTSRPPTTRRSRRRGDHVMSVFAQYAPYELAEGDWDSRRDEIGELVLDAIAAYAPDLRDCIEDAQVLGPPDIERADRPHRRPHLPGRGAARTRCGTAASTTARRSRASTSAAPRPTPAAR